MFPSTFNFSDQPTKNNAETFENFIKITKDNDHLTEFLLEYSYSDKNYRLIAINLSKQKELEDLEIKHQINFTGNLDHDVGAGMFASKRKFKKKIRFFSKIL